MELWRNAATELPEKQCSDVLNCVLFPEKTVVEPDTVLSGIRDRIGWYQRNIKSVGPANLAKMQGVDDFPLADPLLHRTFGALIATGRPQRVDGRTLQSTVGTSHLFGDRLAEQAPRAFYAGLDGADGAVEVVALGVLGQPLFDGTAKETVA